MLPESGVRMVRVDSSAACAAALVSAADKPVPTKPLSEDLSEIAVSRRVEARRARRREVMDGSPSRAARLR
jgi:hypothetical protein